jgi:hypothetical protein
MKTMRAESQLDPNDFVAVDEVFGDDYSADSITHAWFTIIPGDSVDAATLTYDEGGTHFLGGPAGPKWAIRLYGGYRFNGQALPLHDPGEPRHVLENLSGTKDLSEFDWSSVDWASFE